MQKRKQLSSHQNLINVIAGRSLYIWGARHEGYAARLALSRNKFHTTGYIDSSAALAGTTAFGLSITDPSSFFATAFTKSSFIVIASGFYADEIVERCEKEGWIRDKDFTVYGDLRRFNYQIDVAGICNLSCISCPRGNWPRHRKAGLMSAEIYSRLIDKIVRDDPWTGIITLYNWGEPLLNPALPEIINISREKDLLSAISSNLSMEKDFEDVIRAGPDWFRISNSGWGTNFETTHTGASWDTFLANCKKLAHYRQRYHPEMLVELFFHIYSHNRDDFTKIKALCDELGFTLRYRHAALAPLDNIALIEQGAQISDAAKKTRELQFLQVENVMEIARNERDRPCFYLDHLWIDWDLSVAHCMEWYDPSLKIPDKDFLSLSLDEIDAARIGSEQCRKCMEKGIHRAYCVYGDEKLIDSKSSIPIQKDAAP